MIQWYVYAIGAAVFATLFEIFRKKALSKVHAMNFESARTIFMVLLCLFLIPFISLSFDKINMFLVYLTSLLAAIGILYAAKAFRHGDISLITPLSNLRPAFIAIIAVIFLSESLSKTQITGIAVLFATAYLLAADHHISSFIAPIKHFIKSKYSLYFLFATFLFAVTAVLDKFIITNKITNIFTYFFFVWIFLAINLNIIHALTHGIKETFACIKKTRYLAFIVAVFSFISNLLALKALSMAYVSLVMPIVMLSTLLVVLFGGRYFHEKGLLPRVLISILMLIGAYLVIV